VRPALVAEEVELHPVQRQARAQPEALRHPVGGGERDEAVSERDGPVLAELVEEVAPGRPSRPVVAQLDVGVAVRTGVPFEAQVLGEADGGDDAARDGDDDPRELAERASGRDVGVDRSRRRIGRGEPACRRRPRGDEADDVVDPLPRDARLERREEAEAGGVRDAGGRVVGDGGEGAPIASDFPPGFVRLNVTFDRSADSTWAEAGTRARRTTARTGRSLFIAGSPRSLRAV